MKESEWLEMVGLVLTIVGGIAGVGAGNAAITMHAYCAGLAFFVGGRVLSALGK